MATAFIDRIAAAPRDGGFRMEGYWVWCGSVIQGEDGRYHMFASRWRHDVSFTPHWVTNSEIVRASADTPLGPFGFEEVVFAPRDPKFWDGRMTHNPTIHKSGDTYLLYYIGTTYDEPHPTPENPIHGGCHATPVGSKARSNQRIGLATSKSIFGPWERPDAPILEPRPGKWDGLITVNPAPCVLGNGSVLLIYKSTGHAKDLLRMGVARAERFDAPYERLSDDEIFGVSKGRDHIEDAYVWESPDGGYEVIMKDMNGGICGEKGGGIHGRSRDGVHWTISDPPKAYSRTVRFDDGTETRFGAFERPQLLIEDGRPTVLYAAVGEREGSEDHWGQFVNTWNQAIPLR